MKKETKESYTRSVTSYNKLFYWYFLVLISVGVGTTFFISKTFAQETITEVEETIENTEQEIPTEILTHKENKGKLKFVLFDKKLVYFTELSKEKGIVEVDEIETTPEQASEDMSNVKTPTIIDEVSLINSGDLIKNQGNMSNSKKNSEILSNPIEKMSEIVYNYNPVGNSTDIPQTDNSVVVKTTPTENPKTSETNKDFVGILVNYNVEEEYITIDVLETIEINSYETFGNLIKTVCSNLKLKFYENTNNSYFVIGNNGFYYLVRYGLTSSINSSGGSITTEDVLLEVFSIESDDIATLKLDTAKDNINLSDETFTELGYYNSNNFTKIQSLVLATKYRDSKQSLKFDNYTLSALSKNEIIKIFSNISIGQDDQSKIKFTENAVEFGEEIGVKIIVNE